MTRRVAFKNGKLYLFRPRVVGVEVVVVKPWGPKAGAWLLCDEQWKGTRFPPVDFCARRAEAGRASSVDWPPGSEREQLLLPFWPEARARRAEAWRAFFKLIPADVLQVVRRFRSSHQYSVLSAINRCRGAALELARSNACLMLAVACTPELGVYRANRMRFVRRLLGLKRREAAAALGFEPPSDSRFSAALAVRVLAAIPSRLVTFERLRHVRRLLASPGPEAERARKLLAHTCRQRLSADMIRLITDFELVRHVAPVCFQEIADRRERRQRPVIAEMAKAALRYLRDRDPRRLEGFVFRRISDIEDAFDEAVLDRVATSVVFPMSRFRPRIEIRDGRRYLTMRPIDDPRLVVRLSRTWRNCLAAVYMPRLESGEMTAWTLTVDGEDAVVLLEREGRSWEIVDIRRRFNRPASVKVWRAAKSILDEYKV